VYQTILTKSILLVKYVKQYKNILSDWCIINKIYIMGNILLFDIVICVGPNDISIIEKTLPFTKKIL